MARKGENIYKRKDGRWEGRFIVERKECGKARYQSVYGKTYLETKEKLRVSIINHQQRKPCAELLVNEEMLFTRRPVNNVRRIPISLGSGEFTRYEIKICCSCLENTVNLFLG